MGRACAAGWRARARADGAARSVPTTFLVGRNRHVVRVEGECVDHMEMLEACARDVSLSTSEDDEISVRTGNYRPFQLHASANLSAEHQWWQAFGSPESKALVQEMHARKYKLAAAVSSVVKAVLDFGVRDLFGWFQRMPAPARR